MAATGNEVPLLSQILRLKDNLVSLINQKLVAPAEQGTNGQILVWQMPGSVNTETIWMDPTTALPPATQSSNGLMTSADKTKLDGFMPSGITIGETEAPATGTPNTIYIQMLPAE